MVENRKIAVRIMAGSFTNYKKFFKIVTFEGGDFFMPQKKCWLFVVARPRVLCYDENIQIRMRGNKDAGKTG